MIKPSSPADHLPDPLPDPAPPLASNQRPAVVPPVSSSMSPPAASHGSDSVVVDVDVAASRSSVGVTPPGRAPTNTTKNTSAPLPNESPSISYRLPMSIPWPSEAKKFSIKRLWTEGYVGQVEMDRIISEKVRDFQQQQNLYLEQLRDVAMGHAFNSKEDNAFLNQTTLSTSEEQFHLQNSAHQIDNEETPLLSKSILHDEKEQNKSNASVPAKVIKNGKFVDQQFWDNDEDNNDDKNEKSIREYTDQPTRFANGDGLDYAPPANASHNSLPVASANKLKTMLQSLVSKDFFEIHHKLEQNDLESPDGSSAGGGIDPYSPPEKRGNGAADPHVGDPEAHINDKRMEQEILTRNAVYVSNLCNLFLLFSQLYTFIYSGSLSLLANFIDASLDMVSGIVILVSWKMKSKRDKYNYPVGRQRLEPLGVIAMACLMTAATILTIEEAVTSLIEGFTHGPDSASFNGLSKTLVFLLLIALAVKGALYLYCRKVKNASVQSLAADHANDILSNSTSLIAVFLAGKFCWWIDPLGGIVISILIIRNWVQHTLEHVDNLLGKAASNDISNVITFIACNHHPLINQVDTVRAYHVGSGIFVEVDICLPGEIPLTIAHEIGESLQMRIEKLEEIERAFVHLDFETDHSPYVEHKIV